MTTFVARPAGDGLRGRIRVPGDKSISHRALLLAARAEGTSRIRGLSHGADVRRTRDAIVCFGAAAAEGPAGQMDIEGGVARVHEPLAPVDLGNSGTAMRLLAGWASGVDGLSVLHGDESLSRRPMARVVEPLCLMGAAIDGRNGGSFAPLVVRGGGLHGIDYRPHVASAQVKGAILLAGIAAEGETIVREDVPTRAHTEEMLAACGADVTAEVGRVSVRASRLLPFELSVPGDPSQAAFWVVAACVTPGSELTIDGVYLGQARTGFIDVLSRMGADLSVEVEVKDGPSAPRGSLTARYSALRGTDVGAAEVPALIDEIPALAVAAAYADGTTTITGAGELAVKESNRIASVVSALRSLGADCEPLPDGLRVGGTAGRPLPGGRSVNAAGDHRVAMAAAVAALAAREPATIEGWEWVATSYPGFEEDLERCR